MSEKKDRNEIKQMLRDWMTQTCQLRRVNDVKFAPKSSKPDSSDITFWFRLVYGISMNDKWVDKALYGKKKNL